MFTIEEFIIAVFCCIDELWQQTNQGQRLRSRGFAPSLRDAEVIPMEIVAEFQGIDTDKGIWQYFRRHWLELLPQLQTRSTFVRQAANLWSYKQQLQRQVAVELGAVADKLHIVDGLPIPLCCFRRAPGCRSFPAQVDYGYCAAKDEVFYGFRGHLLISGAGVITSFTLTPANGNQRAALWDLLLEVNGLLSDG